MSSAPSWYVIVLLCKELCKEDISILVVSTFTNDGVHPLFRHLGILCDADELVGHIRHVAIMTTLLAAAAKRVVMGGERVSEPGELVVFSQGEGLL